MKIKMHYGIFAHLDYPREISNINRYIGVGLNWINVNNDCFIKRLQERQDLATCFHTASLIFVQ